jgi:hypothetical protein
VIDLPFEEPVTPARTKRNLPTQSATASRRVIIFHVRNARFDAGVVLQAGFGLYRQTTAPAK